MMKQFFVGLIIFLVLFLGGSVLGTSASPHIVETSQFSISQIGSCPFEIRGNEVLTVCKDGAGKLVYQSYAIPTGQLNWSKATESSVNIIPWDFSPWCFSGGEEYLYVMGIGTYRPYKVDGDVLIPQPQNLSFVGYPPHSMVLGCGEYFHAGLNNPYGRLGWFTPQYSLGYATTADVSPNNFVHVVPSLLPGTLAAFVLDNTVSKLVLFEYAFGDQAVEIVFNHSITETWSATDFAYQDLTGDSVPDFVVASGDQVWVYDRQGLLVDQQNKAENQTSMLVTSFCSVPALVLADPGAGNFEVRTYYGSKVVQGAPMELYDNPNHYTFTSSGEYLGYTSSIGAYFVKVTCAGLVPPTATPTATATATSTTTPTPLPPTATPVPHCGNNSAWPTPLPTLAPTPGASPTPWPYQANLTTICLSPRR